MYMQYGSSQLAHTPHVHSAVRIYYPYRTARHAPRRETRRRPLEATCALEVDATCAREEEDACAREVVRLEGLQEEVAPNSMTPWPAASRPPRPRCRCGGTRCPRRRRRRAHKGARRSRGGRSARRPQPASASQLAAARRPVAPAAALDRDDAIEEGMKRVSTPS